MSQQEEHASVNTATRHLSVVVNGEGGDVRTIGDALVKFYAPNAVPGDIRVRLNGRTIDADDEGDTPLRDGDTIYVASENIAQAGIKGA